MLLILTIRGDREDMDGDWDMDWDRDAGTWVGTGTRGLALDSKRLTVCIQAWR